MSAVATRDVDGGPGPEVHFSLHGTFRSRITGRGGGSVKAVDGVSFDLRQGEVLGLVGESGSGKTTLGRALLGLVRPTGGSVKLRGQELAGLSERQLRPMRRHVQMVFQDPHASLNPGMTLETALAHPLQIHNLIDRLRRDAGEGPRDARAGRPLADRALRASSFPSDLSGGQKQRAAIARAIIVGPDLLVADEPVSMLDMSVRAKILDLMIDLKHRLGLTYVYVTHDLASAKFFCDRVAIMYLGRIVEIGVGRADLRGPQAPVHAGADPGDPRAGPGQGAPARPAARRDPRRGPAAARLLVPPALPEGLRDLRLGEPRPARDPRGALAGRGEETYRRAPDGRRPREARRRHEAFVPDRRGQGHGRPAQDAARRSATRSPTSRCGRACKTMRPRRTACA